MDIVDIVDIVDVVDIVDIGGIWVGANLWQIDPPQTLHVRARDLSVKNTNV